MRRLGPLFGLLLLTISRARGFIYPAQRRHTCPRLGATRSENTASTIEEDIEQILDLYLTAETKKMKEEGGGLQSVSPTVLMENAAFLCKGRLYEKVIKRRMETSASAEEAGLLQRVDSFMLGFIKSERKSRSRLKVNYIIAGATSNRLDRSIDLLHEADEIDEDLMQYISGLIKRQTLRLGGPAAESEDDLPLGTGKNAIEILKMIYKRLEAQMKTQGKAELILLAKLMLEQDPSRREDILKDQLYKVEDMENFAFFVESGIEHLTMNASSQDQQVSVGKVERMKDILLSAKSRLQFYQNQNEVFSTRKEEDLPL